MIDQFGFDGDNKELRKKRNEKFERRMVSADNLVLDENISGKAGPVVFPQSPPSCYGSFKCFKNCQIQARSSRLFWANRLPVCVSCTKQKMDSLGWSGPVVIGRAVKTR
jgi:hypothetical protein